MVNLNVLVIFAAASLSAQVRLQYLDLGPLPAPCCMVTDANGNTYVAGPYTTAPPAGSHLHCFTSVPIKLMRWFRSEFVGRQLCSCR